MQSLDIRPNLDLNPWVDLTEALGDQPSALIERVGLLPEGMASGDPTLELIVRMPDGSLRNVRTSWRLMRAAFQAFEASPVAPRLQDRP